ncbi:hypothetical protein [Falsiroseomonas oryzae]|uniref:hypothetical protein n=1 Tax=Falsiroseomonas oryzae TaxID=2766473 RepID=UPI0022EA75ED|nr:hypothetical protein [Roseomonas sp. MO-31]
MLHNRRRVVWLSTVSMLPVAGLAAGCAPSASSGGGGPFARIDFLDSDAFDAQLRRAMRDRTGRIVVKPQAPIRTGEIPPRLNLWLTAVAERGGQVAIVPPTSVNPETGEQSRSLATILSLLNPLLEHLAGYVRDQLNYAPAAGYDAQLVVVAAGGDQVQSFVFRRR